MIPLRAGDLRHRVTLQSRAVTADPATGALTPVWTDVATVPAAVDPLHGREYFAAASNESETDVRVRIRYYPGITNAWRVKFGARYLDIQDVMNVEERNRYLHLMCKEYTDGRS